MAAVLYALNSKQSAALTGKELGDKLQTNCLESGIVQR